MITDKLRSYGAAKREVMASVEHRDTLTDRHDTWNQITGDLLSQAGVATAD